MTRLVAEDKMFALIGDRGHADRRAAQPIATAASCRSSAR